MKVFNIKGIVILIAVFIVVQLASAFIVSPFLAPVIIENINKVAGTKISADKITVWPLTLSLSLKNLKIFDPDNEKTRIAFIKDASLRISPIGLLSKRLVVAKFGINNAEINLKGEPDGSFNVQKLTRPKEAKARAERAGVLDRFRKKKDWFGRISGGIKQKLSEKEKKVQTKVEREVEALPRGRLVKFIKPNDRYIFEIKNLVIKNSKVNIETENKERLGIENAGVYVENLGLDPAAGARFSKLGAKGIIKKNGKLSGSFDLDYAQSFSLRKESVSFSVSARDVDLAAIKFVYDDSVPVEFEKGTISVTSRTNIVNENLDSSNSIILKDHTVLPRNKTQMVGFLPLPIVCDALNKINPVKMNFKITGTIANPEFKGFEQIILELIKPYVADLQESLKREGLRVIGDIFQSKTGSTSKTGSSGEDAAAKTMQSIKSIFGSQDKE